VQLCNEAIAVNSTAFEDVGSDTGARVRGTQNGDRVVEFQGTWTAEPTEVVPLIPFSRDRKAMSAVVRHAHDYRFYVKGVSEILGSAAAHDTRNDVEIAEIDDISEENHENDYFLRQSDPAYHRVVL
jgi:magnesium-transporting ATPase (P-type)